MHFLAMYRLRWYRRAFTRYGASYKYGVGKQATFESISLAWWRWRLVHCTIIYRVIFVFRHGAINL